MQKIYKRTPMPKSDFSKVAKQLSNFIEVTLSHRCSPVNFQHVFRTPFFQNTSGGLLLDSIAEWCEENLRSNFYLVLSTNKYMIKVNNKNTRKICEVCSKLTIKTRRRSGIFIVNFGHISYIFQVFILLNLNR